MTTLPRVNGGVSTYTAQALNGFLASLRAAGQARLYLPNGVAALNAGWGVLLVDVSWSTGLRIAEQFEAGASNADPFGVVFTTDSASYSLPAALAAVGYPGVLPPASLAAVYMALYDTRGGVYADSSGGAGEVLVASSGLFGQAPAVVKRLVAGPGVSFASTVDAIEISGADLTAYVPFSTYTPFAQNVETNAVFRQANVLNGTVARIAENVAFYSATDAVRLVLPQRFMVYKGPLAGPLDIVTANATALVTVSDAGVAAPKLIASTALASTEIAPAAVKSSTGELVLRVTSGGSAIDGLTVRSDHVSAPAFVATQYLQVGDSYLSEEEPLPGIPYTTTVLDAAGPMQFRQTIAGGAGVAGIQRTPLRITANGVCELSLGVLRNSADADVMTVVPDSTAVVFASDVTGRLLSQSELQVFSSAADTPLHIMNNGAGGSSLRMYAAAAERWLWQVFGGTRDLRLSRVSSVAGNRLEEAFLGMTYSGTPQITAFADLTVGASGNARNLTVLGVTSLQGVTCTALSVNGTAITGGTGSAVLYEAQSLTAAQQTVARTNISALSSAAGAVSNTNIASNAAIAQSKIANLTDDLSARVLKAGDTMTGGLTAPALSASQSAALETAVSIFHPSPTNFSTLYLTAGSAAATREQAKLYVGQGGGLVVTTTNAARGTIWLQPGNADGLTLPVGGPANFAQTPTVGSPATALVLTNDARLSDTRVPTDGSVTEPKLANNAVSSRTIQTNAVSQEKLAPLAVSTGQLADNAVTEIKLADNAVATAKILNGAVAEAKLADNAVATAKIANSAVTSAKIATLTTLLSAHGGLSVRGAKAETSPAQAGVLIGRDASGGGNTAIEITAATGQLAYLDLGGAGSDFHGRLLCTPSTGNLAISATTLNFNGPITTSSTLAVGAGLSATTGTFSSTVACTRLTASAQPHVVAYRNTVFTVPPGGLFTVLPLNAFLELRGANIYNTATNRFECAVAGVYAFHASWGVSDITIVVYSQLIHNGVCKAQRDGVRILEMTATISMAVGDWVEMRVSHNHPSGQNVFLGVEFTRCSCTMLS